MRETKMLSTILYMACISMDTIMGRDIFNTREPTGSTPILFSTGCCFSIRKYVLYLR